MKIFIWQQNNITIISSGTDVDNARENILDQYFPEIREQYLRNKNTTFFNILKTEPIEVETIQFLGLDLSYRTNYADELPTNNN